MAAAIRRLRFADGSIRLGPEFFRWGDPYTRSLSFEVERVNVAVIGGLTWVPSRDECRWIASALAKEGLRPEMDRVVRDGRGNPLCNENGNIVFRRVKLTKLAWHLLSSGKLAS